MLRPNAEHHVSREPVAQLRNRKGPAIQHDSLGTGLNNTRKLKKIHRRRTNEIRNEHRRGLIIDDLRFAELLDDTMVHDHDLVAHLHGFELVMRNVNRRRAHAVVQIAEFFGYLLAKLNIERTQGFVHEETFGLANDGATKRDFLPIPAGEATHGSVQYIFDLQYPTNLGDTVAHLRFRHALAFQRVADVLTHIHMRIKRKHLENECDVALAGGLLAHVLAVDQNLAGRRQFKTGNHPERRRLAAARRPQQHKELAVFDRERRRLDGGEVSKVFAHVSDNDLSHLSLREMTDDDEHHRAHQRNQERVRKRYQNIWLHQHKDTKGDQDGGDHLPRAAVKSFEAVKKIHHFRTAPNVMPRSRCFRSKMVKTMTGTRKIVAPAATAGQS